MLFNLLDFGPDVVEIGVDVFDEEVDLTLDDKSQSSAVLIEDFGDFQLKGFADHFLIVVIKELNYCGKDYICLFHKHLIYFFDLCIC